MSDSENNTSRYDPGAVESKWQRLWEKRETNKADLDGAQNPYFNLMMFPYPSAEGLHVGNLFAFIGADIHGRFRRLQGYDVFEPLGFDAFGIHSENYALKVNTHPAELIPRNVANFRKVLHRAGLMVDWDHEVNTTDPGYYKWTQWVFLKLFDAGIAERKEAPVNWCPECKTVLANEQVVDGMCERHPDVAVIQKFLAQWFFRITDYAERLLDNLEKIDWSDSTRMMQRNWIGRSTGADLEFETPAGKPIKVFTTRPDTIFGATFLVIAPEHPLVDELTTEEQRHDIKSYQRSVGQTDLVSRRIGSREKTGAFTGSYARNPATGESIPIWIADYVLMEYGTGAIMAVPGHDERDFEFAQKYGLEIKQVVVAADGSSPDLPFQDKDGSLVNSGEYDGMKCLDAIERITADLEKQGRATSRVQYRLHDWCVSRQRYWGPPIPIIYCDSCGPVGVPESDLPVMLPEIDDFRPDDSGVSPLARHDEWYRVPCPKCGAEGRRETDVSDTFLDSAWYFLRYPSTDFSDRAIDPERTRRWLPVDSYIGGNEHAVLHLMYARFVTMVLKDLGHLDFEEPFTRFRAHGTIVKDGAKMSKSRGNVIVPDAYMDQWGSDTFRMYLMFLGPYQEGGDFRDEGISGIRRFLDKVWNLVTDTGGEGLTPAAEQKLHQTIKKVADDLEELRYNTAISALMEYVNVLRDENLGSQEALRPLAVMLAPLAPHFAEECWERLGGDGSVFDQTWPEYHEEMAQARELELVVQVNGKLRARIQVSAGISQEAATSLAKEEDAVRKFLEGKEIRKAIFVPDRLVNLVV